jgi:hypothetical protein
MTMGDNQDEYGDEPDAPYDPEADAEVMRRVEAELKRQQEEMRREKLYVAFFKVLPTQRGGRPWQPDIIFGPYYRVGTREDRLMAVDVSDEDPQEFTLAHREGDGWRVCDGSSAVYRVMCVLARPTWS